MAQVDRINGLVGDLGMKAPVRVATTANITLSGLQTVDGVVLVAGDRVLVKDQTAGAENGIYAASATAWLREPDWDGSRDVVTGTAAKVNEGTQAAIWAVATSGTITVGTTAVTFTPFFPPSLDAALVINTPSGSIVATDVQAAIDELEAEKAALAGATFTGLVNLKSGADIASAATVDLTAATGNTVTITGTTATSAFTMNDGQHMTLVADAAWPLTYHATTCNIIGGASYTCKVDQKVELFKTGGVVYVFPYGAVPAATASGDAVQLAQLITNNIVCTTTNDSAAAGDIGEYISSEVLVASAVAITTNTTTNVTSISLTAGDWDVSGFVGIIGAAGTSFTYEIGGISTTSATRDVSKEYVNRNAAIVYGVSSSVKSSVPTSRISISSTTTVYLVATAEFTVSTASAFGKISARRAR